MVNFKLRSSFPPPLYGLQVGKAQLSKMERAARLINKNKYSRQIFSDDEIARGLWPTAVGKAIARHTGKMTMVRSTLVVEVEDAVWQKQLFCLSRQILDRLQKLMGSASIQEIEFRTGVPRRQPQRADSLQSLKSAPPHKPTDEADDIQDAVLKKVYRLSRKRAIA